MVIPPQYTLTPTILTTFAKIEANRSLLQQRIIPQQAIENIRSQSLLKSSLFSAKIEGNTLTLEQIKNISDSDSTNRERLEIANILRVFSYLQKKDTLVIDRDFLLELHSIVMKGLEGKNNLGKLRKDPSAIFNESGFAVYIPPPPSEIPILLEQLIQFLSSEKVQNIPIRAILGHYVFEKIHPFLDGNGRVGRLLLQTTLARGNYHFNWLLSFEEVLNSRKAEYYAYLGSSSVTEFVEFMLEVLLTASDHIIEIVTQKEFHKEDVLLPRRKEMLQIIRDQTLVSLDMIQRRFLKIPARTLRYDLKKLEEDGFISKVGTTRGAMYKAKRG